jgi:hypothetical protein
VDAPELDPTHSAPAQFFAAARSWDGTCDPYIVDLANDCPTMSEAWRAIEWAGYRLWMLKWAGSWGLIPEPPARELRLFACWCARRALKLWRHDDRRSRLPTAAEKRPLLKVIRASEAFALEKASAEDVATVAETLFPPHPPGCVNYRWEYRLLRAACLETAIWAIEEPWQAARIASDAATELAEGCDIKPKKKTPEGWEKARMDARFREGVVHAQKLHRVLGNPFVDVGNDEVLRIAKAVGIRPWECSNCGGRKSEIVERPDGTFRRCVKCKALASRLT